MNPVVSRYKIPFLISLVIALGIIAFSKEGYWLNAIFIFIGSILGFLLIDIESILVAYVIDPLSDSAVEIKSYIAQRNFKEYVRFLNENEYTFGEVSIRSLLFQVVLFIFALYVTSTNAWVLVQALSLSMFANLLYVEYLEYQSTKTLERWFWIYDGKLNGNVYKYNLFGMLVLMLLLFTFV